MLAGQSACCASYDTQDSPAEFESTVAPLPASYRQEDEERGGRRFTLPRQPMNHPVGQTSSSTRCKGKRGQCATRD